MIVHSYPEVRCSKRVMEDVGNGAVGPTAVHHAR